MALFFLNNKFTKAILCFALVIYYYFFSLCLYHKINFNYSFVFQINENNELQLAAPIPNFILTSFDPTLKFNIEVADNGNPVLTFNQTFTVTLTDVEIVKAGLPQLAFSKIDLFSNMTKGFEIGRLIREGVDMEDMVITITQNFEDLFTIRDSSMLLLANDIESINMTRGSVTVQILDTDSMESALHQIKVENHNMKCECKAGMVCVVNRNSAENVCRCEDDYDEVEGRCIQVNDCLNATCVNGGTCIDDIRSYICRCMKGYKGQSCDIKENATSSCVPNPCLHGICVPDNGGYSSFNNSTAAIQLLNDYIHPFVKIR
ncbi:hypothetical protein DPMN_071738 [Dreissena polymorpha]|uniref:EGF-like domain-containing protein n=1 Tax=Dreissena polymorpha TaxID=45954 RepID=A0A9D3Z7A6_DREPO|nr:hypothetical protein DPMN_071738 [Dreissena polymorpha]